MKWEFKYNIKVNPFWVIAWSLCMMVCGAIIYHFSSSLYKSDEAFLGGRTTSGSVAVENQEILKSENGSLQTQLSSDESEGPKMENPTSKAFSEFEKSQIFRDFLIGVSSSENRLTSNSRQLRLIGLEVFDTNGKLTDLFAQIYGLTDYELLELSSRSDEIREEYFSLASKHSKLSEYEKGSVRVEIEPFDGGGNLYSELLDSFEMVLGPDRFSDFMRLSEQRISDNFYQFGGEKLDILVTQFMEERRGPEGNPMDTLAYKVSIKKEGFNRNGSSSYNGLSEEDFSEKFGIIKRLIDDAKAKP